MSLPFEKIAVECINLVSINTGIKRITDDASYPTDSSFDRKNRERERERDKEIGPLEVEVYSLLFSVCFACYGEMVAFDS